MILFGKDKLSMQKSFVAYTVWRLMSTAIKKKNLVGTDVTRAVMHLSDFLISAELAIRIVFCFSHYQQATSLAVGRENWLI